MTGLYTGELFDTIDKALHKAKRQSEGKVVVAALTEHKLIKPGIEIGNLAELIDKRLARFDKCYCGCDGRSCTYAAEAVQSILQVLGVVA